MFYLNARKLPEFSMHEMQCTHQLPLFYNLKSWDITPSLHAWCTVGRLPLRLPAGRRAWTSGARSPASRSRPDGGRTGDALEKPAPWLAFGSMLDVDVED
jgi:hypothetical protein